MSTPRCEIKLSAPDDIYQCLLPSEHEGLCQFYSGVAAPLEPTQLTPKKFSESREWFADLGSGCSDERTYWFKFAEAYAAAVSKNLQEELAHANFQLAHEREISLAVAEKNSALINELGALPEKLEKLSTCCFNCGRKLEPHRPAIFAEGKEVGRQETDHKWCPNCLWVASGYIQTII